MNARRMRLNGWRLAGRRAAVLAITAWCFAGCGSKAKITAPSVVLPASDSAPSWSPDGTRIAYAHTAGTVESADRAGIYVADTLGGTPIQILAGPYGYPDWSPDGRHLVVSGGGIFTITPSGGDLTKISSARGYAAKWSPDGTTIAYETYDSTQVYRVWLMASDGTNVRCLNPGGSESWLEPDWAPDGVQLAHARLGAGIPQAELFVMDTTGHGEERIWSDGFEARYPTWSRDGKWIAWGSWRGTRAELWVMQYDTPWGNKLTDGWWPDWAPDSRHIAYTSSASWNGSYRLFIIDCLTGQIRQITH